jgi:phospholipid transport system substrate-binding protein
VRLNRRSLAVTAAFLLAACLLPQGVRAEDDPAAEPVRKLYAKVEEALKNDTADLKARVDTVGPTLLEVFDTGAMVPVAVGAKWKGLKPEQQSALSESFGPYFTTLYANRLSQAAGGKFEIKPGSRAKGDTKIVQTRIATKEGDETDVDYVVNGNNRIQDVLLNGNVSEVANMRASFSDPLKKGGADGLVKFMKDRIAGMLAAKRTQ